MVTPPLSCMKDSDRTLTTFSMEVEPSVLTTPDSAAGAWEAS